MKRRLMARAEEPRCPLCGESVVAGARRCDNCGAELGADEEASFRALFESLGADAEAAGIPVPPGPPPESQADGATRAAAGSTLYLCPSCGAFVSSADARCPRCGADLATEATPPVETGMCPHCGSAIPVTAEVCPACDRPVAPEDEEAIPGLCPNCGSVAPTGRQTCAVCGASLRPGAVPAPAEISAEPPAPAAVPGPPPPPQGPLRPPVRPRRVSAPAAPAVRERAVREPRDIPPPPEPEASVHEEPPPRPGPAARTRPARMPVHGGPPEPRSPRRSGSQPDSGAHARR